MEPAATSERRAAAKGRRLGSSRRKQLREGSGEAPAAAPGPGEEPPWASEMVQRVQDIFRERDKDQAGFVTRSDMQKLQEENFPCSTEELELVFDGLDAAGTGQLSTEEFTAGLRQFLSSHKAATGHRRRKTASRRVRLVLPSPALEGADSEEQRHFAAFMEQLGTDGVSDEQEIWQLWVKLRQDEPQLLGNLEDFLAKMRHRIQEARSKKAALEVTLNKRVAEHDKEVQQLCEALEQRIQQEQQRLEQESLARSHQHGAELQRVLDASEREVQRLVTAQMELETRCRSLRSTQQATSTENQQLEESNRVLEDRLQHLHQQLQQTHGRLRTARAAVAWEQAEELGDRAVAELPGETPVSPQTSPEKREKYRSEMRIRLGSHGGKPKSKSTHQVVWEMQPAEISLLGSPRRASSAEEDPFPESLKEERFSDQSSLLREMNDAIAALSKQLKPQALGAPPTPADTAHHLQDDAEPQMGLEKGTAQGTTPGVLPDALPSHTGHKLFEGDLKEGPAAAELCAPDVTQAGASMGAGHLRAQEPGAEQGESPEEVQRMLFSQGKGAGAKELMLQVAEHLQGALGESMEAGEQEARMEAGVEAGEQEARMEAGEQEARMEAGEQEARMEAGEQARMEAGEQQARMEAGEQVRMEAGEQEARVEAGQQEARMEAGEQEARMEAGEQEARMEAGEQEARMEAGEQEARMEAGEQEARMEAGEQEARMEAGEQEARMEAGEQEARMEAGEQEARMEAGEQEARMEAGEEARMEAGEQEARMEAGEQARMEAGEQARMEVEGAGWTQEKTGWEKAQVLGEAEEAALSQGENLEAGVGPPAAGEAGLVVGRWLTTDEPYPAVAPGECAQPTGTALGEGAALPLGLSERLEIKPGEHLEPEPPSQDEMQMGAAQGDGAFPEVTVAPGPGMLEELQLPGEASDADVLPAQAQRGGSSRAGAEAEVEVMWLRVMEPPGESAGGDTSWGGHMGAGAPWPVALPPTHVQEGGAGTDVQPLEAQSSNAYVQLFAEVEAALQPPSEVGSWGLEQGGRGAPGVQPLGEEDKPELGLGGEMGAAAVHGEGPSPAGTSAGSPDPCGMFPVKAQALELVEAEDAQADARLHGGTSPETPQGAAIHLVEEAEDGEQGQGGRELPHEPGLDPQGEGAAAGVRPGEEAVILGTPEAPGTDAKVQPPTEEEEELKSTSGWSMGADLAPLGAAGLWAVEQSQAPGPEAGLRAAHARGPWEGAAAGAHVSPPAEGASCPEHATAGKGPEPGAKLGALTGQDGQILEDPRTPGLLQGGRTAAEGRPLDGAPGLEVVQGEALEAGARSLVEPQGLGPKQGCDDPASALAPPVSEVPLQISTLKLETVMQEDVLVPDVWQLCASGQAAQSELREQVSAQADKVMMVHAASQQPEEKPQHVMETEQVAARSAEPPEQEVPPALTLHTRVQQEEDAGNDQLGMVFRDCALGDAAHSSTQPQGRLLPEQSEDLSVGQREKMQEAGWKTSSEGEPSPGEPRAVTAGWSGAALRGCPEAPLDPDHLYNVLFVGDSHVGKTSFLYRLHADTFNPHLTATVGLDYQIKHLIVDNRRFALRLWDSAGQERYHSVTKQFFRKADGVVLMYDITSEYSFSDVRYWLSCIQEGAEEGVAVLLLGNKTDCAAERRVPTKEGERLAKEHQLMFYECSAASGHNVSESMVSLVRLLKVREDELKAKADEVPKPPQKQKGCC
uniref:EF-hand domain-containing protein n=1 Tax=Falco tinnunculus TaxID=100819 RepID=A0A8C4V6A0_FALTI